MTTDTVRRGRPRSAHVDALVTSSVLELISESGLGALTIEAVANRAGVGKTTLYRRWPNKNALVLDALAHLNDSLPAVHGDSLRERLVSLLSPMQCRPSAAMPVRLMPRMISHREADPELYRCFFERVIAPRRERFLVELRAGVAAGEIRDDVDLELAVNALVGPVLYQSTVIPETHIVATSSATQLVDLLLSGLSPRPSAVSEQAPPPAR